MRQRWPSLQGAPRRAAKRRRRAKTGPPRRRRRRPGKGAGKGRRTSRRPPAPPPGGTQKPAESGTEWSGLEQTAPPAQPAAAGLYWGLARLRAAAAYGTSAPGRTVVRVPAPASEGTPGLRPAELDRLFQRDARRYDGRFTLF